MTLLDCTKDELLAVVAYMRSSVISGDRYLARALAQVAQQRENKAMDEADKVAQEACEFQKRYNELLREYEGVSLTEIPMHVLELAREYLSKIDALDRRYEKLLGLTPAPRSEKTTEDRED